MKINPDTDILIAIDVQNVVVRLAPSVASVAAATAR